MKPNVTALSFNQTLHFALFTRQKRPPDAEVEAAAVYAIAELERSRGGGLIVQQPEENLLFIAKMGYPLWLYPKNDVAYIFDGLNPADFSVKYLEMPSATAFKDSLEISSKNHEKTTLSYLTIIIFSAASKRETIPA